ncbi:hypothetical protein [Paenibacillus sp. MY03]|jgi:hypothetical protein|nr:hypothetical protein [Paenibacillus sp. MY03]
MIWHIRPLVRKDRAVMVIVSFADVWDILRQTSSGMDSPYSGDDL